MSVLINGMGMTECCSDCDLHNPFSETPYCRRLLRAIPLEGRLENCPLADVPVPHGRLIDADALLAVMIETLEAIRTNPKMDNQEAHILAAFHTVGEMVKDATTIIEAEE